MSDMYVERENIKVKSNMASFIEKEALKELSIKAVDFWRGFSKIIHLYVDRNRDLLQERENLQDAIDSWHKEHGSYVKAPATYKAFLYKIGYLVSEPKDFIISTSGLDAEITDISAPQLVVPLSNARYALNAANARWGSLYDALYGSDVIKKTGLLIPGTQYNLLRGQEVFDYVSAFLDRVFPLTDVQHSNVTAYEIEKDASSAKLVIRSGNRKIGMQSRLAFRGYREVSSKLYILLRHHGLHVELVIDRNDPIGRIHPAGLSDIFVESAVTVIQDCEDSVAAVDAEDKITVYRNWLGLMKRDLQEVFEKHGKKIVRRLNQDRHYRSVDGDCFSLKGSGLMMVRNVGHFMMTDTILDKSGHSIGEGLMDGVITTLCAMHDMNRNKNSRMGAVYIVKPKMHGPREVAFTVELFSSIEKMLGLGANTIKIGIMDEERRTSANLKACIKEAEKRVFFINTGFLDRTGDEIHTSLQAGLVLPKEKIKSEKWIYAYEDRNVITGLRCGFMGRAQIGKGMWAKPDAMHDMLEKKIDQLERGANCAWVPSPTAATLHALHYHDVNVEEVQKKLRNEDLPSLSVLFSMPFLERESLSPVEIQDELDNNAQGILGYVVHWVHKGIGCSKVLDISQTPLMEDRATCRISAQVIVNWLKHGLISEEDVYSTFQRMAIFVDEQNKDDSLYSSIARQDSIAFQAALTLALKGDIAPSGYTDLILHAARRVIKQRDRIIE
ncbi:MAG: malate synthase [Candidatus Tokpelaia sp. JSC161]|jgi:malate synthase|nr:MAG: malate synthase [Candidatus Tokpelaia sp. JSC161]